MRHLLDLDILDQKDSGFYNMSPFHNDMRLKTAAQLADATENALYVLAGIAIFYALSTIALFFGVYKNKPGLIIPWLVLEFLGVIAVGVFIFMLKDTKIPMIFGGQCPYCEYTEVLEDYLRLIQSLPFLPAVIISYTLLCMDGFKWYVMHSFYQSLRTMNKLREIATVAIPCPAPGAVSRIERYLRFIVYSTHLFLDRFPISSAASTCTWAAMAISTSSLNPPMDSVEKGAPFARATPLHMI